MTTEKSKTIKKILDLTKADPASKFDSLSDRSEEYLDKLLKICEHLKKQKHG